LPERKTKDRKKGFGEALNARITAAGVSDSEVALNAGISKGLLSQLKAGHASPSQKVVPSLAWALCRTPSMLYDDICSLLREGGFEQPCQGLASILAEPRESVWVVVPPHYNVPESALNALHSFLVANEQKKEQKIEIRLFTTIQKARSFWRDDKWNKLCVKTPSELLLNLDHVLVFIDVENAALRRMLRSVSGYSDLVLIPLGRSVHGSYLSRHVGIENQFLNIAEVADFESKQAEEDSEENSLVILYTKYFPEEGKDDEGQRLYETVKSNLKRGVRYLYLVPALDELEAETASIAHNSIKNRLKTEHVASDTFQYNMIKVRSPELYREGTFILYARLNPDFDPEPHHLLKQVEGPPIRFVNEDMAGISKFYLTVMKPLRAKEKEIEDWLRSTRKKS
jgi:hypothetical protein